MANTFSLKKGDTQPPLTATLYGPGSTAVDLTTATSIRFQMRSALNLSGADKVNSTSVAITSPTGGGISYSWQAADTDTAGTYYGQFVVTFPAGVETVPNGGMGTGHFIVNVFEAYQP